MEGAGETEGHLRTPGRVTQDRSPLGIGPSCSSDAFLATAHPSFTKSSCVLQLWPNLRVS